MKHKDNAALGIAIFQSCFRFYWKKLLFAISETLKLQFCVKRSKSVSGNEYNQSKAKFSNWDSRYKRIEMTRQPKCDPAAESSEKKLEKFYSDIGKALKQT